MLILLKRFKHSLLPPSNPYPAVKEYQATTVFLSSCSETTLAISEQAHFPCISTSAVPTKNQTPKRIALCIKAHQASSSNTKHKTRFSQLAMHNVPITKSTYSITCL
ncbi:hypothetical protein NC652_009850 [Populus alba x Populus x berolinensis]|uniref:Uncharacterized protein n=1 Tax=Populus alba x Populus x berolinensis TaxID=444605 RepID=A0AAD6RA46_9ROSI|nr:hypothetical protein NC652_009850 [Populus alba x Populus x berolinensis]KAJ7005194.1 hypothetical protein NC653_009874 [Populus alba x Populus x berolinensis]KAJ7005199.1 hypothetical protein NC653_009878 [Populus alba x Populus x berolinensis]KAJ7005351.1 hypothetical protein NC653_009987 [Populus alba x Populus x berolinensis]